ncbi:transmembrane protein 135-like isoform X2 [Stylophora pistillata]|uniref:transmembrane protein 135-like isoform X2 n=1 Tax=Stylophora pistillata TaxID=50429 RepID=UPI000C047A29|nr:transmembrane protein 135-like isoform X2 [Stylophora pistillata]
MVVFSKILHPFTTTLSCHELAHTWTPSCSSAAAGIFRSCFVESLKIYGLLYMIGGILRKAGIKYFKYKYLLDVIRSSCFLAVNGGGLVVYVCLVRRLLGSFSYLSTVFLPGFLASLNAILVEKKSRRGTLALYMTNLILLFSIATAIMMYLYRRKGGLTDGVLNSLVRFFLGPNDQSHCQEVNSLEASLSINIQQSQMEQKWLQPTLKAFSTGYIVQLVPMLLGQIKHVFKRPGKLLRVFYNEDCLRCGVFLGSFVAIFKIVEWVLELLRNKRDEVNGLLAGGAAGLSMIFYRNSSIALYLASKISEVLYKHGISAGILPSIPYAEILAYSFSTALLFHACTWEVHSVRPSYWRYLNVVTAKRFCELNRAKVDEIFGTESSRLFPKDDLYKSLTRM